MTRITTDTIALFVLPLLFLSGYAQPAGSNAPGRVESTSDRIMLSGVGRDDAVNWDFFCTTGRRSGEWTTIPVPSNWEMQGFGTLNYGHDVPKADEQGKYRRTFAVPSEWEGKVVQLVFEGAMTDTEVWVNGHRAGPTHQGGFFRFSYDVSELVKCGEENLLEVTVSKVSSNDRIEQAERKGDYWVFGGIYRPVYLQALPTAHIEWVELDGRADGHFTLVAHLVGATAASRVTAQVVTLDGASVGSGMSAASVGGKAVVSGVIPSPRLWTAETPNLYQVRVGLHHEDKLVHSEVRRFGFRTFEVRPGEGLFLNGERIVLKGVNRHSFRPDSGRCLSPAISREDVRLMKSMNMNAVRMSHYPPDKHFLETCDELGLYVLDELPGWGKPSYDTESARRLVGQMVKRDQTHPSILFWDNANEGGWNREVDGDFGLYDIQNRVVLHPWEQFGGIDTDHYPTYEELKAKVAAGHLFMPTEFLHGLYDGGHGASLRDYWDLMQSTPLGAGGFLWVLADEGVLREDQGQVYDTDGNHAPDGIVGPNHEKEGSFHTIRQIWSPIQIDEVKSVSDLAGPLVAENHYDFTDLSTCSFRWELVECENPLAEAPRMKVTQSKKIAGPSVPPGATGELELVLPSDWQENDLLRLVAFNGAGDELRSWSWSLNEPTAIEPVEHSKVAASFVVGEEPDTLVVEVAGMQYTFDRATGRLRAVHRGGDLVSLSAGPRVVHVEGVPTSSLAPKLGVSHSDRAVEIRVVNPGGGLSALTWTVDTRGWLFMDCTYTTDGEYDFHGVTFDYPEELVQSKQWLGDGPFRVWNNRQEGNLFGIWQRDHQDHVPGQSFDYPEFRGYFSNVHWLSLDTTEGRLLIATDTPGLFARIYEPNDGVDPKRTRLATFKGDLSFLHGVPPIGTKFHAAGRLGPQGEMQPVRGDHKVSLQFVFE